VTINGVLPLKTVRRDSIANLKSVRDPEHRRFHFSGFICIQYAELPYSAGIVITASIYGGWIKTPVLFVSIWHSFVELKTAPK